MNLGELHVMIKECEIENKVVSMAMCDVNFVRVNRENKPDSANPDNEIVPKEFVAWLVRIACIRYDAVKSGGAANCFKQLMLDCIILKCVTFTTCKRVARISVFCILYN